MYEEPMEGAKRGWDQGWEVGVGRTSESGDGKMETTVFKHQKKVKKKKERKELNQLRIK